MPSYRTAPLPSTGMPKGIPYIIGNEAAERFSFYGMKGILVVFMTQHLMNRAGQPDLMTDEQAKTWFHLFSSAVYFTPLLGALIADAFLGKYRTIIFLSIVYCLGHLALALDDTRMGLAVGLSLISLGAGGIKPCVSSHVGDQFGKTNQHLLPKVYSWFYFSINFGSFFSTILTPILLKGVGAWAAFGVPGVLMLIATIVFWMGRHKFVHIPPGGVKFLRETFSVVGLRTLGKLCIIYLFVAMFWALYDQTGSSWVLQADHMNRMMFGYEVLPAQVQACNPLLIMLLIPLFTYAIYPAINAVVRLTALRKIMLGMFLTVPAFALVAWTQVMIDGGARPHIGWQLAAYVIITAAEVMVSITCLEFSYTQAPKTMKSFIMALFFMSVSLGNLFTAAVNHFIQNPDGSTKLEGANYYWFFTMLMAATAAVFTIVVALYREKTYIQEEQPVEPRCERCHYSLRGITGAVCPECGSPIARN